MSYWDGVVSNGGRPWLMDKREQAKLEANKERVRQVFGRLQGVKSSFWAQGLMYVEQAKTINDLKDVCKSHEIVWKDEGDMPTKTEELRKLKDQVAKINAQIEKLELGRWEREPANGSVFKIERRYSEDGKGYYFAAVRADGLWYLTGTRADSNRSYTWDELQAWAGKYSRVWKLTVAKELVD